MEIKNKQVLVVGFGSIGKRHVSNLIKLGIKPTVVTQYPDGSEVDFQKRICNCEDIKWAIVATPTGKHLEDYSEIAKIGCKKVLIEKPVELNLQRAYKIKEISLRNNIQTYIAYNMRYLKVFDKIQNIVTSELNNIRIVEIKAGQYLPGWRPGTDYSKSYSARRKQGGGVDLDLSHEVDYMQWLFGEPLNAEFVGRYKITTLAIDSPDLFKAFYKYNNCIVDVETDYIRPKERYFRMLGENSILADINFTFKRGRLNSGDEIVENDFNFEESYVLELKEFLNLIPGNRLATIESGIKTMELLKLEG